MCALRDTISTFICAYARLMGMGGGGRKVGQKRGGRGIGDGG